MLDRKRLSRIAHHFFENGTSPVERRGGVRVSKRQMDITASIIAFIKRFPVEDSHYGRGNSNRQYMNPELNITKLWRMWKVERAASSLPIASVSKFDDVFRRRFNLSFRKPRVDVCSYCEEKQNLINTGVEVEENKSLLKVHCVQARRFYDILKESAANCDDLCIAFDMQQNKPLPKTNIGEAYYAHQLWVHNVTFVIHSRKQRKRNVHIYKWLESESGKGSNEIVSALSHLFKTVILKRISVRRYKRIRFFCDSCPGQNKNSSMVAFLMQAMAQPEVKRYLREIDVTFPIRGHLYLPPDRIFGRIEKEQRRIPVITTPAQYQAIDERYGKVHIYGDDWNIYDWKLLSTTMLKDIKDLEITKNRVWRFSRKYLGKVQVQNSYGWGVRECSLLKGDVRRLANLKPKLLVSQSHVSELKRDDVRKLLKFVPLTQLEREFYDNELAKPCKRKKVKDDTRKKTAAVEPQTCKQPPTVEPQTSKPTRGRPCKTAAVEPQTCKQPPTVEPQTSKPARDRPCKNTLGVEDTPKPQTKRGLAKLNGVSVEGPQVKRLHGCPRKL